MIEIALMIEGQDGLNWDRHRMARLARSGRVRVAIVDSGPLIAAADADARDHARCVAQLQRTDLRLIIPAMVIAEVSYFLSVGAGSSTEARFLRGISRFEIEAPRADEWLRIADFVEQYADFPLGATDASVVALAERLNIDLVMTLDRRHFGTVRARHVPSLRLLPEPAS